MNISDYADYIRSLADDRIDFLMRRRMPVIVGRLAKDHFQNNFRLGGFVNGGLHSWAEAKRLSAPGSSAASRYGTLLSGRNHLFSSIVYYPSDYSVRVANNLVYAPVHNWGATVSPTVTDRMRRFAWAKFYEASGREKKTAFGKKNRKSSPALPPPDNPQANFWKGLALTKKSKLSVKVPQRQFIGESEELNKAIYDRLENEIRNIFNS